MGSASALPSLWQVLPHGIARAAALVSEVAKPPDLGGRSKASYKPESQRGWRPFGHHVHGEDVVSTAPPPYLPSWLQAERRQAHRKTSLPQSGSLCALQVVQLRWHGQNDVLMWSFLLLVLLAAAIRHLLLTVASQHQSSLQIMSSALCWLCISTAAVLINW